MKSVLIIDDDSDEYFIYSEVMELLALPITLYFLNDPLEAIQYLRSQMADFILIDSIMPKMNGLELIDEIKELPNAKNAKLVILSTYVNDQLVEKALSAGAIACLQKKATILETTNMLGNFFSNYKL